MLLPSCYKDEGNYDYTDVEELEIDTTGMNANDQNYFGVYVGDTLVITPAVDYSDSDNLTFEWLLFDYPYETETVGNTTEYPAPDTIATTLNLNWIIDVDPGWYRYYLKVTDNTTGQTDYIKPAYYNYLNVQSEGSFYALMLLEEFDGKTDLGVYYTPLALIFSGSTNANYYSEKYGEMLEGSPTLLNYCSEGYYYAFTDQTGVRLDENDFITMASYDNLFYTTPGVNDAQAYEYESNQELLLNNGKLHVINNNLSNDSKFSDEIAGDYDAFPYLTLYDSSSDGALCTVYDKNSNSFLKYYYKGSSLTSYGTASADAYVDPNNLPNDPMAIMTYDYTKTCAIVKDDDGVVKAFLYDFFADDETDLSANGSRSVIDLSGCEGIEDATMFYCGYSGTAFHYVTSDAIYAFSITSGDTNSTKVYDIPSGEEVTSIYSIPSAGFPTGGRVYWFALWNETEQDGSLVEFEMDPNSGEASWYWGAMLGIDQDNPTVTDGFGKITSMVVGI